MCVFDVFPKAPVIPDLLARVTDGNQAFEGVNRFLGLLQVPDQLLHVAFQFVPLLQGGLQFLQILSQHHLVITCRLRMRRDSD